MVCGRCCGKELGLEHYLRFSNLFRFIYLNGYLGFCEDEGHQYKCTRSNESYATHTVQGEMERYGEIWGDMGERALGLKGSV